MPSLFVLPSQVPLSASGALLANATLDFYATGTSTRQNTYEDIGLTTAHANPVVADAAGVFAPIYLDPSLPNYRAVLKTAAGVTLKTWDDVPSNQNTSQQFRLKATAPSLTFEETDASSDNKIWRIRANTGKLLIEVLDDEEATVTTIAELNRTGTNPGSLNFAGQYLRVNDLLTATQENSTATVQLTGVSDPQNRQVQIRRSGTKVSIYIASAITGTSNSTAMTMTGLGTLTQSSGGVILTRVRDNGVDVLGTALLGVNSITFGVGAAGGDFTASGTKGIPGGTLLVFDTDLTDVA